MKFRVGDIVVAKNKDWVVPIGNDLCLNCWKVVGMNDSHYLLVHQEDWSSEEEKVLTGDVTKWRYKDFDNCFEIDIKRCRKKKLEKLGYERI